MSSELTLCTHVRINGAKCKSPALRGEHFCYYHHQTHERGRIASDRKRLILKVPKIKQVADFDIPSLEDGAAIQVAITDLLRAIADNSMDLQQAMLLLRGLRAAAWNLRQIPSTPHPEEIAVELPHYEAPDPVAAAANREAHADAYFAGFEDGKKSAASESAPAGSQQSVASAATA